MPDGGGPSKTRVFDKLFGGPLHGRRMAVDERSPSQTSVMLPRRKPLACWFGDNVPPAQEIAYRDVHYTKRQVRLGDTRVIFYAHSTLDDKRAVEIVVNHMLRDTRIVK